MMRTRFVSVGLGALSSCLGPLLGAAALAVLTACQARRVEPVVPDLPPAASAPLSLAAAGAPVSLFGEASAPDFPRAFGVLDDAGFDAFFPLFVVTETPDASTYTAHGNAFLAPSLLGGDPAVACRGVADPYAAAAGRLEIWFPGLVLLGLFDLTAPIDEAALREALRVQAAECWPDNPGVVSVFYGFDEPVMHRIVADYVGEPTLRLDNVEAVRRAARAAWDVPLMSVEGPGELAFRLVGLPDAEADRVIEAFWRDAEVVGRVNDIYGFNIYPVPDFALTLPGEYVRDARRIAPEARHVSVMQGMALGRISEGVAPGRAPTRSEIRFMAVDSVAAGADVLGWYGASSLDLAHPEDAALWADMLAVVGELAAVKDAVMGQPVRVDAPADVWVRAHEDERGVVVFVSHRSDAPGERTLTLPSPAAEVQTLAGTAPTLDGASLRFDFPAYGASIVRLR